MKGKYITAFLIVLVLVVIALVVFDKKTERSDLNSYLTTNPFEKDVAEYENVPDSLISHQETKQIRIKSDKPRALVYADGCLYLLTDEFLQVFQPDGWQLKKIPVGEGANCLCVLKDKRILIGYKNFIALLNSELQLLDRTQPIDSALFTAIASDGKSIFVANAAQKQVMVFDFSLRQKSMFKGESGVTDQHGFIIPSMHFDLAVNNENELWVVNPGMHALQNYTDKGKLRGYWSKTSFEINGFSGCCNPFRIAFQPDGSLVTSEKGLVRIKIHEASGQLRSVVAAPASFQGEKKAPDVAVDEEGTVYALDFEKNMIRVFTRKN